MKGFISGKAFPISSGHMDASASVPFFGNMALIFWRDEHVETEAKQDRTSIDVVHKRASNQLSAENSNKHNW
jgi:hypothetical protein